MKQPLWYDQPINDEKIDEARIDNDLWYDQPIYEARIDEARIDERIDENETEFKRS